MLAINLYNLGYTCVFLMVLLGSYYTILHTRLEVLFKPGAVWPIRIAQILLSIILAYLVTQGIMSLVLNTQF